MLISVGDFSRTTPGSFTSGKATVNTWLAYYYYYTFALARNASNYNIIKENTFGNL